MNTSAAPVYVPASKAARGEDRIEHQTVSNPT